MSARLEQLSVLLRGELLIPSGGWLADVVPVLPDALGVWDVVVLAVLFIAAWVILRVSDPLTSLILGLTFDVTIPLQYKLNPKLESKHAAHLNGYWPIQMFALGIEALCFLMVVPELFTLVVCLKTLIMTAIWLGKRTDGSFLTERSKSSAGTSASGGRSSSSSTESNSGPVASAGAKDRTEGGRSSTGPADPRKKKSAKVEPKNNGDASDSSTGKSAKPKGAKKSASSTTPGDNTVGDAKSSSNQNGKKTKPPEPPESVVPSGNIENMGFAPPGRGPPITNEEAQAQLAEREARRKARSDNQPRATRVLKFGESTAVPPLPTAPKTKRPPLLKGVLDRMKGSNSAAQTEGVDRADEDPPVPPVALTYTPLEIDFDSFRIPLRKKPEDGEPERPLTREELRENRNTALWETLLEHDSIDLLIWYLKELKISNHHRAVLIMDFLCDFDPDSIVNKANQWTNAYKNRDPSMIDTRQFDLLEQDKDAWRPGNTFWSAAVVGSDGHLLNHGELDKLIWRLRASGIVPPARHAIVRALMSAPSKRDYEDIKETALTAVQSAKATRSLNDECIKKDRFGLYYVLSAAYQKVELEKQLEKGRSIAEASENVRKQRWTMTMDVPERKIDAIRHYHEWRAKMDLYGWKIKDILSVNVEELLGIANDDDSA